MYTCLENSTRGSHQRIRVLLRAQRKRAIKLVRVGEHLLFVSCEFLLGKFLKSQRTTQSTMYNEYAADFRASKNSQSSIFADSYPVRFCWQNFSIVSILLNLLCTMNVQPISENLTRARCQASSPRIL